MPSILKAKYSRLGEKLICNCGLPQDPECESIQDPKVKLCRSGFMPIKVLRDANQERFDARERYSGSLYPESS
jgi:hypothetical protein